MLLVTFVLALMVPAGNSPLTVTSARLPTRLTVVFGIVVPLAVSLTSTVPSSGTLDTVIVWFINPALSRKSLVIVGALGVTLTTSPRFWV